ncbi:class I SAM-dependent methyltransferase [Brumimicrobium glaciale]|uniref:Class I SAM-dependent methyltransferase n=1 Tax=Brumimicrobium glaciale TaxID=200475 RepID=A0A4Q4KJD8_9FLAO|nr:class I SAM-dependent methyltransferase [Brumimicrobium glaciale]RYM32797.1 class I SAM-dependent methyltransferase [Brumimicrobium glaciale]
MDELTQDIFEWDILNWSKALDFWTKEIDIKDKNFKCLELGGRRGGLSLWLAMNNNSVICSDLESPEEIAEKLHTKYNCTDKIEYQSICATDIPYENAFDIVVFKSIMGGISGNGQDHLKKQMIDQIYKSLKPNGKLLFAENLESSFIHKGFRKTFIKWGERWNYLKHDEIKHVFSSFDKVKFKTVGFFGTFGRSESQRNFLSKLDNVVTKVVPKSKRYILFGVAEKTNV